MDTCSGASNGISWSFVEWRKQNIHDSYHCKVYAEVTIGTTHACNVWVADDGWHMNIDYGAHEMIQSLNGVHTAYPAVGGEIASVSGTFYSTSIVQYGAGGSAAFPWTVYRGNNLGSPITIGPGTSTFVYYPNDQWIVPDPPTPFTISHTG